MCNPFSMAGGGETQEFYKKPLQPCLGFRRLGFYPGALWRVEKWVIYS
jgi:hypothetical protein